MKLVRIRRTDPRLLANMQAHYSQPKGFVGRNLCYAVVDGWHYFGGIVAGSATLHLPGRERFMRENGMNCELNEIVNNIFYHVEGPYPFRNFTTRVLAMWREQVLEDWWREYRDEVAYFETLVELPRTGELYKRDGFIEIGITQGFTCKRTGGIGTDSWHGKRVWDTQNLRPKRVLMRVA